MSILKTKKGWIWLCHSIEHRYSTTDTQPALPHSMFFKILYWIVNPVMVTTVLPTVCLFLSERVQAGLISHSLAGDSTVWRGTGTSEGWIPASFFPGPTSSLSSGIQQGRAVGMPLAVTRGQEVLVQQPSPFTSLLINVWLLCLFNMPLGSTTSSFSDTRSSGWAAACCSHWAAAWTLEGCPDSQPLARHSLLPPSTPPHNPHPLC